MISSIHRAGKNPIIDVFNQEISQRVLFEEADPTRKYKNEKLLAPDKKTNDGLFTAIENMQLISSWRQAEEEVFNIQERLKIDVNSSFPTLKREVFKKIVDDQPIRFIEKSRGFWKSGCIEKIVSDENCNFLVDNNGALISDDNGNPRMYQADDSYSHHGLYRVVFNEILPSHCQQNDEAFEEGTNKFNIEWHNGQVRLLITSVSDSDTQVADGSDANEKYYTERKSFNVVVSRKETHLINNVNKIVSVLYFETPDFTSNNNKTKILTYQEINYYPGYKVYLKANSISNLNKSTVLPSSENEEVKYSIFGLRSYKEKNDHMGADYYSKVSVPAVMFAQKIVPPMQPRKPEAPAYSTRPDSFGKSSFSFTTTFDHKPYSILFYRSSEHAMLNALYEPQTIEYIKRRLEFLGGNNENWVKDRWEDFINFNLTAERNTYKQIPSSNEEDYDPYTCFTLPLPDVSMINKYIYDYNQTNKTNYLPLNSAPASFTDFVIPDKINLIQFIKESIYSTFVPLTEVPVIYNYIKDISDSHRPEPKKQKVRDRNGSLLKPNDTDFAMAPMAGRINGSSNTPKVQFVDFSLDGTNRNLYFYCTREMNSQMQMGEFSDIVGPIKTIDTNPPVSPEIVSIIPNLEDNQIEFEISSYHKEFNIRRVTIYRALNSLDARSTRTMKRIKHIDLEDYDLNKSSWSIVDDFTTNISANSSEEEKVKIIPFGDPLFYRITVSRCVQYTNYSTPGKLEEEYVESIPSKLISTMMVESESPEAPELTSDYDQANNIENIANITLTWDKTAYNATYHLYKMNAQGNWVNIYNIKSSDSPFLPVEGCLSVKLSETEVDTSSLSKESDGSNVYHHFKVVAENTSGMLSTEEKILTI
ncbi:hypothetical protein LJB95_01015 [Paludibacteraceae bacterium OttesenSCG-928-F17]|nr:hypothetical protein [Paludibacteraceae bacterium OttesenSCG-928-F17]